MKPKVEMVGNAILALSVLQTLLAREAFTYALIGEDLSLRELAPNFQTFLNNADIQKGQSAAEVFDALIGSESVIRDTLKEENSEYGLEYIHFSQPNQPLRYLSLRICPYHKNAERLFLLIAEDVTSAALIEQRAIQARNELRLLRIRLNLENANL